MDIIQYSTILALASLFLGVATLVVLLGYFFFPAIHTRLARVSYTFWIVAIGLFSATSILGALTYQFVYLTPVCSLCWWQRIFMFPIALIVALALYTRSKTDHLIIGSMAILGLLFASYQYYGHFQKYVLGNPFLIPCSSSALGPSCSESPIVIFGFVTIPFMGALTFATLIWLSYLAHQKTKA